MGVRALGSRSPRLVVFAAFVLALALSHAGEAAQPLWLASPVAGLRDGAVVVGGANHVTEDHVTVVALLSASCGYSRRHAAALEGLRQEFLAKGVPVEFIGINSRHMSARLMASEFNKFVNFSIYESTRENNYWSQLGGLKDDVFIYDSCGRLTYYIPFPNSFVPRRFVELAIQSTHSHSLCGPASSQSIAVRIQPLVRSHRRGHHSHHRSSSSSRKCSCLPTLSGSSAEQHCLCRTITHGYSHGTSATTSADSCFCKWSRAEIYTAGCRCHRVDAGGETCDCRVGAGAAALSLASCSCQESPAPYGQFASGVMEQSAFCTHHAQPLLWKQAWSWAGRPSGAAWEWAEGNGAVRDGKEWSWSSVSGMWEWRGVSSWVWGTTSSWDGAVCRMGAWSWSDGEQVNWTCNQAWNEQMWQAESREWSGRIWVVGINARWSGRVWKNGVDSRNNWTEQQWRLANCLWGNDLTRDWSRSIGHEMRADWRRQLWDSALWSNEVASWLGGIWPRIVWDKVASWNEWCSEWKRRAQRNWMQRRWRNGDWNSDWTNEN